MKKFLTSVACFLLVMAIGVSLAACGEVSSVRLASGDVELSGQTFTNNASLKINQDSKSENGFVVTGKANTLSKEQSALWASKYEGKAYVIVEVDFKAGEKVEYTGVLGDSKTSTNDTDKDDVLQLIRVVEDNEKTFSVKVTEKDAKESTTYTVTFNLDNYKD